MPDYPAAAGRTGYAVGLDVPASVVAMLSDLKNEGYAVEGIPQSPRALLDMLERGDEGLSVDDYLPMPMNCLSNREMLSRRHGARQRRSRHNSIYPRPPLIPPHRPLHFFPFEGERNRVLRYWRSSPLPGGRGAERSEAVTGQLVETDDEAAITGAVFRFRAAAFGNVTVALAPDRGRSADRRADYHDPALPPHHALVAFGLWLRKSSAATHWSMSARTARWNGCRGRRWR